MQVLRTCEYSPLALTKLVQPQLGIEHVHLHLIASRYDLRHLQNLLQVRDRAVRHPDRLDLAGADEFLHRLPRVDVGPLGVQVSSAVGPVGEVGVTTFGIERDRPAVTRSRVRNQLADSGCAFKSS